MNRRTITIPLEEHSAYRVALAPLAAIFDRWKENGLDEDRPDWRMNGVGGRPPFHEVELFSGRGGKQLLTLADAFAASEVLAGRIKNAFDLDGSSREARSDLNEESEHGVTVDPAYITIKIVDDGPKPGDDICMNGRLFLRELATTMGVIDVTADPDEVIPISEVMPKMLARAKEDRERWHTSEDNMAIFVGSDGVIRRIYREPGKSAWKPVENFWKVISSDDLAKIEANIEALGAEIAHLEASAPVDRRKETVDVLERAFGEYACMILKKLDRKEHDEFEKNFAAPARDLLMKLRKELYEESEATVRVVDHVDVKVGPLEPGPADLSGRLMVDPVHRWPFRESPGEFAERLHDKAAWPGPGAAALNSQKLFLLEVALRHAFPPLREAPLIDAGAILALGREFAERAPAAPGRPSRVLPTDPALLAVLGPGKAFAAFREGSAEGSAVGWGATEAAARADLLRAEAGAAP